MCLSLQTVSFKEFSRIVYVFHCSVIKVLIYALSYDSLFTISHHFIDVNSYFLFFQIRNKRTEKEGFEPSRRYQRPTPFPGEPLQPLGYFSKQLTFILRVVTDFSVAEKVGFEPTVGLTTPVFKTGTINHSDTSP